MVKFFCASCSDPIENSEVRFAMSGNFCDLCNAMAAKSAWGRQYKEAHRHYTETKTKDIHITKKDLIKIRAFKVDLPRE